MVVVVIYVNKNSIFAVLILMHSRFKVVKKYFQQIVLIFLFLQLPLPSFSQNGIITVGFQYKPIFNNDFFRAGAQTVELGSTSVTINPKAGFCGGMVIRRGLTDRLSLESGINFTKRSYTIKLVDVGNPQGDTHTDNFKFISYEIPLSVLVFIRLGEKSFMDASIGNSFDFFPSDVYTEDNYYEHVGLRKSWVKAAAIANLGFEYRTEKSGYFYLGASYHRPYTYLFQSGTNFKNTAYPTFVNEISGNYLTLDIRYFFNETPLKNQKKRYHEDDN